MQQLSLLTLTEFYTRNKEVGHHQQHDQKSHVTMYIMNIKFIYSCMLLWDRENIR